jgi:transketolase
MAVGMALGQRMLAARYNRPGHKLIDNSVFVICSDGDIEEGITHESSSLAGHLGLGNLIVFYDDNHISIEGDTAIALSENVGARYEGYGWHVQHLGEDLSLARLEEAARAGQAVIDRPSLIVIRSHIGYGSPNKQDTGEAHGSPLGEEEIRLTKEFYGWPTEPAFYVPQEAIDHFAARVAGGADLQHEWEQHFDQYKEKYPAETEELQGIFERRAPKLPKGLLKRFEPGEKIATRKASSAVIQAAAEHVPWLVGGSADLAPSTLTLIEDAESVSRENYAGRNLHFGIREHGMGAIVNGLSLTGLRAFGATFLIFSDYMKGAIRLAALMGQPSLFVYTHDSIGLGEDGPTHQPIEQLATLRATPNINLLRPADANETALAWSFALRQTDTPSAFALSRQGLPVLDPDAIPDDAIERGAYILSDSDGDPAIVLIGTGSEVSLCMEAAAELRKQGIAVRVVSMPCMDTFAERSKAEHEAVLGAPGTARIAVEAASPLGWDRWIGERGAFIGMRSFGASAPYTDVYNRYGITTAAVVETAQDLLGS